MSSGVSLSPPQAGVGDRIEVSVKLEAPGSSKITLRNPTSDATRTRLSVSPWHYTRNGNSWTLARREVWAAFEPGASLDWRYGLTIASPSGARSSSELVSAPVKIVSVLPASEKNPSPAGFAPPRTRAFVAWQAVALALVLLAAVVFLALRRRSRKAADPEASDDEIFDRRIASLEGELARGIPGGKFFDGLAETTRWYLERKLGLPASRQTSTEIAAALRGDPRGLPAAEIAFTLAACDGFRFARREELRSDAATAISRAREAAAAVRAALAPPAERRTA